MWNPLEIKEETSGESQKRPADYKKQPEWKPRTRNSGVVHLSWKLLLVPTMLAMMIATKILVSFISDENKSETKLVF
jgi:hypothetical protein